MTTEDTEVVIRSIIESMTEAFNRHDGEGQASFFAEDADFVSGRGLRWLGRSEIESGLSDLFRSALRSAHLETLDIHIRIVRDDLVCAHVKTG